MLLIEDEARARRVTRLGLESFGYQVTCAPTARAARSLIDGGLGSYTLALVDLILPDGAGADLIEAIRARRTDLPIVACSGYQEESLRVDTRRALAGFLTKPFSLEDLVRILEEAPS